MTTPIGPIGPQQVGQTDRAAIPLGDVPGGRSFADTLAEALGDVTRVQDGTQDIIARFVRGDPVPLHEVMIASEEAALSLELLVEVRNKLTEAYRTVMNMQT